ncbi:S24/S26 family peptidase [candidate division KSB1 bacterium]|nr:S24/S26 family peptidase [candidate division KSB1 bacterium]
MDPVPQLFPNRAFAELMAAVLERGVPFRFQANGGSMAPFIRNGDIIIVAPIFGKIRNGDVIAFIDRRGERLKIHRAIRSSGGAFLMRGDNSPKPDGWVPQSAVLGKIIGVEHLGKCVRLGLGWERRAIAYFSRFGLLVPLVRFLRPVYWKISR